MPKFKYTAIDSKGRRITDEIEANDRLSLIAFLKKESVTILSLKEITAGKKSLFKREKTIHLSELVIFSRQLATLVKTGITLVTGLNILSNQIENPVLRNIVNSIQVSISSGKSLSEAMSAFPGVFSPVFVNMVRAGEMGGALDDILEKVATYIEEEDKIKRRLRDAAIYPAIVITMAVLIVAFLFFKVIPEFQNMFSTLKLTLPLPTRVIIALSNIFRKLFLVFAAGGVIGFILLKKSLATEKGKFAFHAFCLKAPVAGKILNKAIIARFSRTLATLVKSGIPILKAIDVVAQAAGNKVVEKALLNAKNKIAGGEKIGNSLRESGKTIFAPMVVDMISVGEETGDIFPMLDKIADFYEADVNSSISRFIATLEPTMIIFLGLIVGLIATAMFLPIMELVKKLGAG